MFEKLKEIESKFLEIEKGLADPSQIADQQKLQHLAKSHAELAPIVSKYKAYQKTQKEIEETSALLEQETDEEFIAFAKQELDALTEWGEELETQLKVLILPRDANDEKNVIMEIRAGTGGEEASLFAAELFRMYSKYAEQNGCKIELFNSHATGLKGFKEIIFSVSGAQAYGKLKYEGGTHRVQRVPTTEASGRIHTSAVTVAVLPEAEEVDLRIDPEDLRIEVFRSSGPGGQSVNTTDSAVRITYIPTELAVSCQDEKSQHKNRAKAMKILRSRLLEQMQAEQDAERAQTRRTMIGSGDRSEKIRTYNFSQNRVTDHRIGLSVYQLDVVLNGDLDTFIAALIDADQAEKLKNLSS
jgi:peptide chain release factor 1